MSNSTPNYKKELDTTDQLIIVIPKERLPTDQLIRVKMPDHSICQPH